MLDAQAPDSRPRLKSERVQADSTQPPGGEVSDSVFSPVTGPLARVPAALQMLRTVRRLPRRELAAAASLPVSRLTRYERGETSPTLEDMERLLVALGCPPALFWEVIRWLHETGLPRAGVKEELLRRRERRGEATGEKRGRGRATDGEDGTGGEG